MASWSAITDWLMKWEGGYQAMPNDSGNYDSAGRLIGTNHGIAAITYEQYLRVTTGEQLTAMSQSKAIARLKALTESDAKKIGKKLFWDTIRGDEIENQSVANVILQWYWGRPASGIKLSKKAISGFVKGLTIDSVMRSSEVKAINEYKDQKKIFETIKQAQYEWYDSLDNAAFEDGWLRRISSMAFSGETVLRIAIPILLISAGIVGAIIYFNTHRNRA